MSFSIEKVVDRGESLEIHIGSTEQNYRVFTDYKTFLFVESTNKNLRTNELVKKDIVRFVIQQKSAVDEMSWDSEPLREWTKINDSSKLVKKGNNKAQYERKTDPLTKRGRPKKQEVPA